MIVNLYDPQDMELLRKALMGKKVGLTSGCFDLFHIAHEIYLSECKRKCGQDGVLIVGVDSDDLVRQRKTHTPTIPENARLQMVASHKGVGAACIIDSVEDFGLIARSLKVNFIFKNQDYIGKKVHGVTSRIKLIIIPDYELPHSTGAIAQKVISGRK